MMHPRATGLFLIVLRICCVSAVEWPALNWIGNLVAPDGFEVIRKPNDVRIFVPIGLDISDVPDSDSAIFFLCARRKQIAEFLAEAPRALIKGASLNAGIETSIRRSSCKRLNRWLVFRYVMQRAVHDDLVDHRGGHIQAVQYGATYSLEVALANNLRRNERLGPRKEIDDLFAWPLRIPCESRIPQDLNEKLLVKISSLRSTMPSLDLLNKLRLLSNAPRAEHIEACEKTILKLISMYESISVDQLKVIATDSLSNVQRLLDYMELYLLLNPKPFQRLLNPDLYASNLQGHKFTTILEMIEFLRINGPLKDPKIVHQTSHTLLKPVSPVPQDPRLFKFIQLFENNDFDVVNVKADGNCLFWAVADQLNIAGQQHVDAKQLRAAACDVVRQNYRDFSTNIIHSNEKHRFGGHDSDDKLVVDRYIEHMSKPGEYGDSTVIQALSVYLNRPIMMYQVVDGRVKSFRFGEQYTRKDLRIALYQPRADTETLNHFVSLHPKSSQTPQ